MATQPTVQDLSQYALLAQATYAFFDEVDITDDIGQFNDTLPLQAA